MQEEEFDEFEEATYSQHSQPQQQAPSQILHASLPVLATDHSSLVHTYDAIQGGSALHSTPFATQSLQIHSSLQDESIWPELGKVSSAHSPSEPAFMVDFTKNYSLTEQMTTPVMQDFLNFDSLAPSQPQNLYLQTPLSDPITQDLTPTSLPIVNSDFLTGLSSSEGTLGLFGQGNSNSVGQPSEGKVELFKTLNPIGDSTNLYVSSSLSSDHDFGLFTTMESVGKTVEIQTKIESTDDNKQLKDSLSNEDQPMQFNMNLQTLPDSAALHESFGLPYKQQIVQEGTNLMGFETQAYPVQSTLADPEIIPQPPQTVEEAQDSRKESQQFQFHEPTPPQPTQVDARKQSDEFVFEAPQQHPPSIITQQITVQQPQKDEQFLFNPQQQTTQHSQPIQEITKTEHPKEKEIMEVQQNQPNEQQQDEFGDFQETPQVSNSNPPPESEMIPSSSKEDNTIRINQEYIKSQEGEFYRRREKELQEFVDSLPDYSFLFAKGFLV